MCTIQQHRVAYPPEIMAYMFPNHNVEVQRNGINLLNWSCHQKTDGSVRAISCCDDESHVYVYNDEMRNYYVGPVVFKGRDMHLYAFDIPKDVQCVITNNGKGSFQFELGRSIVIALHMEHNTNNATEGQIFKMLC